MEAIEALLARHSTRSQIDSTPIDPELIETILKCGESAPSSKNARPWRFHVVTERTQLREVAQGMLDADGIAEFVPLDPVSLTKRTDWPSTVVESAATLRSAGAAIFIENSGEFSRSRRTVAAVPRELLEDALIGYSLELLGIGAAVENLWIAATATGVSASFIGDVLVAEAPLARALGLQGDLVGVLALSMPPEESDSRPGES